MRVEEHDANEKGKDFTSQHLLHTLTSTQMRTRTLEGLSRLHGTDLLRTVRAGRTLHSLITLYDSSPPLHQPASS